MQFTHAGFRQSTDLQNMIRGAHFNDCEESDKSILMVHFACHFSTLLTFFRKKHTVLSVSSRDFNGSFK